MVQNLIGIVGGSGERRRESICALMQGDIKVANITENLGGKAGGPLVNLVTCILGEFVPQCAEAMLQSRKSIVYVEFGK